MDYLPFVQEAISSLGYVKPEFDTALAICLEANENNHPRSAALLYRKMGTQLTSEQKRASGIHAGMFFSQEALESLTVKGLSNISKAHEVTMLRAALNYFRARTIEGAVQAGFSQFQVMGDVPGCAYCAGWSGAIVGMNHAQNIVPENCAREACAVSLMPYFDYLDGIT